MSMQSLADEKRWDDALSAFPAATVFHSAAWSRVLCASYGYRRCYVQITEDGEPTALLPLIGVESWATGKRGISLPFTDECAPLYGNRAAISALLDAVQAHACQQNWKYLEFRGGQELFDSNPDYKVGTAFYGHALNLQQANDSLLAACDSPTRRAIRKAERQNLEITFSTEPSAMHSFYPLMCQTRRRHGLPPQPWSFFANIHRELIARSKGVVALARLGDAVIAGAVFLHSGRTALYKFGASDESAQQFRPNNLLLWEAISWHAARGFLRLDFGRTSLQNAGLRRFKLGWGTTETHIAYTRINPHNGDYLQAPDRAHGTHSHVFRALPPRLARLAGQLLYKHIA